MGTFVTGNPALPPLKTDLIAPVGNTYELNASDINDIWAALGDLRTHTTGITVITEWGASTISTAAANTTAITNALNSGAGRVIVPPGTFNVNELSIPTGVIFEGVGAGKSILTYAGTGACITMDSCHLSEVKMLQIITSSAASGVRGVWIKNTTSSSQWNTVENCLFIQNNATGRNPGQVGILIEDNAAAVNAQFWHTIEKNRFLSWETNMSCLQSGVGADGVNQSFFMNNMGAAFITSLKLNPKCGDHVIVGLFGSHSSPSAFTDTCLVIGDGTSNSAGNVAVGIVSDMGATGSAFTINNHATGNFILGSNNESSGIDQYLADSTNTIISNKATGAASRHAFFPDTFLSGSNSIANSLFLGQALRATRLVVNTNASYTVTQPDFAIAFKGLTGAQNLQIAINPGQLLIVADQDGSASASNTITALAPAGGTIDGAASKIIINSSGGKAMLFPVSIDGKTWISFRNA